MLVGLTHLVTCFGSLNELERERNTFVVTKFKQRKSFLLSLFREAAKAAAVIDCSSENAQEIELEMSAGKVLDFYVTAVRPYVSRFRFRTVTPNSVCGREGS